MAYFKKEKKIDIFLLNGLQRGGHVPIALLETLLNAMLIDSFVHIQMYV